METAHACGIAVEGEQGYVPGVEGEGAEHYYPVELAYTSLVEAKAYVEHTDVDFLAISIGTVHGHMKGKPKLDYSRLKQINDALEIPLVIHGGSGLSDDQFHRLISNGVAKINCFTALSDTVAKQIKQNIKSESSGGYIALAKNITLAVATEVERCMRLWGSAGRAAEVLVRCTTWTSAEHTIIYDIEGLDVISAKALMAESQRILSSIPGVRKVFIGEAVNKDAIYRYTCQLQFCHPEVINHYSKHPQYIDFMTKRLRSAAGKFISVYYQAAELGESQYFTASALAAHSNLAHSAL